MIKRLKDVMVDELNPSIYLTVFVDVDGDGKATIHHIESWSLARDACRKFVPLQHASRHRRRMFDLEAENAKLRDMLKEMSDCDPIGCCCHERVAHEMGTEEER